MQLIVEFQNDRQINSQPLQVNALHSFKTHCFKSVYLLHSMIIETKQRLLFEHNRDRS